MNQPLALCWGSVRQADLPELAALAARNGFAEISAKVSQLRHSRRAGWSGAALRRMLEAHGVRVGVIDPLLSALPGVPAATDVPTDLRDGFDYSVEECVGMALELNARTINLAHFLGQPTDEQQIADALAKVAATAAAEGLRVSLEFIPGTGVPDLAVAREIIARSGAANAGIMFDTWHFLRSGGVPADLHDLKPGEIFELQISDRRPPAPHEEYVPMTGRLAPGEGEAPLAEMLAALRRSTPDLIVGVEVFSAEQGDPDGTVARLAAATRRVLKDAACS